MVGLAELQMSIGMGVSRRLCHGVHFYCDIVTLPDMGGYGDTADDPGC
jgi:hypothetical protein